MNGTHIERVLRAVRDEEWQRFRRTLKGLPTEEKLQRLWNYYRFGNRTESDKLRVDNYIKALCRGGQLYPGESFDTFWQSEGKLRIRKPL